MGLADTLAQGELVVEELGHILALQKELLVGVKSGVLLPQLRPQVNLVMLLMALGGVLYW